MGLWPLGPSGASRASRWHSLAKQRKGHTAAARELEKDKASQPLALEHAVPDAAAVPDPENWTFAAVAHSQKKTGKRDLRTS